MKKRTPKPRPRDWMSRLDEVRENGDRRAALPLLERFLSSETDDDHRCDIAAALSALEDPRLAEPLRVAALDVELSTHMRALALAIYATIPVDVAARAELLPLCRSPDAVTRAFGVRALDVPDGDALAAAAGDPSPLVRYAAIDATASIARTRPLVAATRRAFADDDAGVREAACRVGLFDEPLDVTHELVAALGDASIAVRVAACDALEDFPRISVLLALADARGDSEPGLAAELAFAGVTSRIRATLADASPRARVRIERWAAPVRWLLSAPATDPLARLGVLDEDEDEDEPEPSRQPRYAPVSVTDAVRVLCDEEAPPATQRRMLVFRSWKGAREAGRELLRECAKSPNWSIRQGAAFAFGDLRAVDELVALASDREPVVRRAAFEELRKLASPRGLVPAMETLADPTMRPTAGDDALALIAQVAHPEDAERVVLAELARPDDRDGLWLGAIHIARHLEIDAAEPHLRRIAESEITSSVLPHVAALSALREMGRTKGRMALRHLESLDHLEVQRELGEWGWKGGRYG